MLELSWWVTGGSSSCHQDLNTGWKIHMLDSFTNSIFRDSETLAASARASRFAKYFQPLNDLFAEQNKLIELQRSSYQTDRSGSRPPVFLTSGTGHHGQGGSKALYYSDTFSGQPQQPRSPLTREVTPLMYDLASVTLPTYVARFRF